jgi:nucleotide-binding universal stress UspA family protein
VKNILVTTDFSELADKAIGPAAEMAHGLGAPLTLAHVLTSEKPPEPDPNAPYYKVAQRMFEADQELEQQIRQNLRERADACPGACNVAVARGGAVPGLLALAEELQADLIVISSQGRSGFKRLLLGSVAEQLARESAIPVLIWKDAPG